MPKWYYQPIGDETSAPAVAGNPYGFAWEKDDTQHVVYRGKDGQIHELWFRHKGLFKSKSEWNHNPIGIVAGGPPAASDPIGYSWEKDKTQHVIYRGTDDMIYELWCRGGKWAFNPLSKVTGAPSAAGNPHGYAWERDDTQHVVYRGVDGQIHEIWYRDQWVGQDWHYNNIGEVTGAAPAAGDPFGYAWEKDKTQHVIYRGTENLIHEIWGRKGKWGYNPIGRMTDAPPAAGDPVGYAWEKDDTQHVLYRGVDGKIHEIWYRDQWLGQDWHYNPISDVTGAPPAASDPFGYAWEKDGTQHVLYVGVDGQIHQLWYRNEWTKKIDWHHNPIGDLTDSPAAVGKPTGYAWEGDKTQHVIYRGEDNKLHELWLRD
jgi:hypothetical protein